MKRPSAVAGLRPRHFFTMAFGSSIGVSWIVLAGGWVTMAGPFGAATSFVIGGLVIGLIALVYAEMASRYPVRGGEVAYTFAAFGTKPAFAVAWLLLLAYLGIAAFEAVSAAWVVKALIPTVDSSVLYVIGGRPVTVGDVALGAIGTALIAGLNLAGVSTAARVQSILAWGTVVIGVVFVGAALVLGDPARLAPAWPDWSSPAAAGQAVLMAATAPYFMSGFNAGAQILGDRDPSIPVGRAVVALLIAVAATTVFYASIPVAVALALPRDQLATAALPVAAAASALTGSPVGGIAIISAGLFGMLTVWNAVTVGTLQIYKLLGRARMIPAALAIETGRGVPVWGLAAVVLCCLGGTLVGRAVLLPVIGVGTICYFVAFVTVGLGAIRMDRREGPAPGFQVPLGRIVRPLAVVVGTAVLVLACGSPALSTGHFAVPLEWYLLVAWIGLGCLAWHLARADREAESASERVGAILVADTGA